MKLVDLVILVFLSAFIATNWLLGSAHWLRNGLEDGALALIMVTMATIVGLHFKSYMRHRHALHLIKKLPFEIKILLFIRFLNVAMQQETRLTSTRGGVPQ